MTYDILAFDPDTVTDEDFPAWWEEQSSWHESHSYDDAAVTTPSLRTFYRELISVFPPMNGPDAPSNEKIDEDPDLESRLTDYTIGTAVVYAAFAWSQDGRARALFTSLASKHGVAVALFSDDIEILRPSTREPG
ncbi:hypothetical protein OL239_12240 [Arthrobacter sp. ATA002]|uniref:hypothetical protein n=1 Tax=Arthrobacter sp. ATA002 TaxID=2991715 RepID=UPI0022A69FB4|nr:hypothetical protein [Arthrobacter sp. ATA002]WAP50774.1 hypothetical protein OL239_12240 [Arthrobacter sp. ATA002]